MIAAVIGTEVGIGATRATEEDPTGMGERVGVARARQGLAVLLPSTVGPK